MLSDAPEGILAFSKAFARLDGKNEETSRRANVFADRCSSLPDSKRLARK
jgi:hypothetical protein